MAGDFKNLSGLKGFKELKQNLEVFKKEVVDVLGKVAFHGATLIQNEAKQNHGINAHSMGRYKNRYSNLTNSIQAQKPKISGHKIKSEVVAGMEYAEAVETGGTHRTKSGKVWVSKPYPFMFPAFENNEDKIMEAVKNAVKKIKWVN